MYSPKSASKDYTELMMLVKDNPDCINLVNGKGWNALMLACKKNDTYSTIEM